MKVKLLNEGALRRKYPESTKGSILLPSEKTLWLPCEALALNWQLGGGIPLGKIVELFGYESTGKSLLAMGFGKVAQSLGGVVLWGDAESSYMPDWAEKNGMDPARTEVLTSQSIETFSDWSRDLILYYRSRLTKNEPILLVEDSIAALETDVEIDSDDEGGKAKMGNRAKAIYQFLRKRNHFFVKMGVAVIFINQVRKKLGATMFESAETTPGGDAPRFYASQRIGLNAGKQIKGKITRNGFREDTKGTKFGRTVYVQVHKNKVAPPKNSVKTEVYFLPDIHGYTGYSKYHGVPEILEAEGVVTRKGSYYKYKDHAICQGEDNFIEFLHEDEKRRKILIGKSSINTTSKTRAKMEAFDVNLYPVKARDVSGDDEDE